MYYLSFYHSLQSNKLWDSNNGILSQEHVWISFIWNQVALFHKEINNANIWPLSFLNNPTYFTWVDITFLQTCQLKWRQRCLVPFWPKNLGEKSTVTKNISIKISREKYWNNQNSHLPSCQPSHDRTWRVATSSTDAKLMTNYRNFFDTRSTQNISEVYTWWLNNKQKPCRVSARCEMRYTLRVQRVVTSKIILSSAWRWLY